MTMTNENTTTTNPTPYGPGKFRLLVDSLVYSLSLEGPEQEAGSTDCLGWAGLLEGNILEGLESCAVEGLEGLAQGDREYLAREGTAGAILLEDSQGFVEVTYYRDPAVLARDWQTLAAELDVIDYPDDEPGDDEPEETPALREVPARMFFRFLSVMREAEENPAERTDTGDPDGGGRYDWTGPDGKPLLRVKYGEDYRPRTYYLLSMTGEILEETEDVRDLQDRAVILQGGEDTGDLEAEDLEDTTAGEALARLRRIDVRGNTPLDGEAVPFVLLALVRGVLDVAEVSQILTGPDGSNVLYLDRTDRVLILADKILGTCGIESVDLPHGGDFAYCNTGESYDGTLGYLTGPGSFVVSSWAGEWEASEQERTEETGEVRCAYCGEWAEPGKECHDENGNEPTDPDESDDESGPDDYTITPTGPLGSRYSVGAGGKHVGEARTLEGAYELIRQDAGESFRPTIWNISDHGNPHVVESFQWEPEALDRGEVLEAMARLVFLSCYADAVERLQEDGEDPGALGIEYAGSGDAWEVACYAVETPQEAKDWAREVLDSMGPDVLKLGARWVMVTGQDAERFGDCLAYEVQGHGVGLMDDLTPGDPHVPIKVPHREGLCLDALAYAEADPEDVQKARDRIDARDENR